MLAKLVIDGTPEDSIPFDNPDQRNLVQEVSMKVIQSDLVSWRFNSPLMIELIETASSFTQ